MGWWKGSFPCFLCPPFFFSPLINDPGGLAHPSWASGSLLIFPLLLIQASALAWSLFGRAVDCTRSEEAV